MATAGNFLGIHGFHEIHPAVENLKAYVIIIPQFGKTRPAIRFF